MSVNLMNGAFKGYGAALEGSRTLMAPNNDGLQWNVVDSTMTSLGFPSRERTKPGRHEEVYDWMDIIEKYEGVSLPLPARVITAATLNNRGMPLVQVCAPPFATPHNNFTLSFAEPLMIPFDEMETGGVPRTTTTHRDVRSFSMHEFKRAQKLTMQAFMDPIFGQGEMNEIQTVIAAQAILTVMKAVAVAVAWTPFEMKTQYYQRHADRVNCARQIWSETTAWAEANNNAEGFVARLTGMRAGDRPLNVFVFPENASRLIAEVSGESRSIPALSIVYNAETRRYLEIMYDGPRSFKSLSLGDGSIVDFIESPDFRQASNSSEKDKFQALRAWPVLCEVVLQRVQQLHDPATGSPTTIDPYVHDQQPTSITIAPLTVSDSIKFSPIWWNYDSSANNGNMDSVAPGNVQNAIIDALKKNRLAETIAYFADWEAEGGVTGNNDHPHPESITDQTLVGLDTYRDVPVMVSRNAAGDNIEFPKRIGDIERRHLPDEYLERAAQTIIDIGCAKLKLNKAFLEETAAQGGRDPAVAANATAFGVGLFRLISEYLPSQQVYASAGDLEDKVLVGRLVGAGAAPAAPRYYQGNVHLATKGQPLEAFLAGHSLATLLDHLQQGAFNSQSEWVQGLSAVPANDAAVRNYLTISHAAQTALEQPQLTADQRTVIERAVGDVHATLQQQAGKSTAALALKTAAERLGANGNNWEALSARPLVSASATKQAVDLSEAERAFAVLRVGVPDAMDIDDLAAPAVIPDGRRAARAAGAPVAPVRVARGAAINDAAVGEGRVDFINDLANSPLLQAVLIALCSAANSRRTHLVLAQKLGIQLFRTNFWRPFQTYQMMAVAACVGAGESFKTAINHAICNTVSQGQEQYLMLVASFRMRVLPMNPQLTDICPHSICNGFYGGLDTQMVRSRKSILSAVFQKPSVIPTPVPIDEFKYNWPMHMVNQDVYRLGTDNGSIPNFKHSGAAYLEQLMGINNLRAQQALQDGAKINARPPLYSQVAHCSNRWYRAENGNAISQPGNGPRGAARYNVPTAAEVWAGGPRRFPLDSLEVSVLG